MPNFKFAPNSNVTLGTSKPLQFGGSAEVPRIST